MTSDLIGNAALLSGASILGFLAAKYNDRAVFYDRPKGVAFAPGAPLVGSLFEQIKNKDRFLEAVDERHEQYNTLTM